MPENWIIAGKITDEHEVQQQVEEEGPEQKRSEQVKFIRGRGWH